MDLSISGGDTINEKKKYEYARATETYNGKRYEARGKTQREAYKKLAIKLADIKRNGEISGGNMQVRQWASEWLSTYVKPKVRDPGKDKLRGTISDAAYRQTKNMVENYIVPAIGNKKLKDITPAMLQRVLNDDPCRSFSHVQKLQLTIRHLFKQAWLDRKIQFDPSANLVMPATDKGIGRGLTAEEKKYFFLAAENNPHGLMFRFLMATGMRPNELMALTVGDVDLDERTVHVHSAVESGTEVIGSPKTNAGTRFTVINIMNDAAILDDLRRHTASKGDSDLIFTNTTGGMLTRNSMGSYWRSFARDIDLLMGAEHTPLGHIYDPSDIKSDGTPLYPDPNEPTKPRNGHKIAPDLVTYCLRHTFGTDMQRAGIPINITKYLMGHVDISTTANIYIDSGKDDALQAIRLMQAAVAKPVAKNKEAEKNQ